MNKLVIITQRIDEEDDLLGFFVDWIHEFAKHFEKVDVITLAHGRADLPSNVRVFSLGKEKGRLKIFWPFIFYWRLFQCLPKSSGVFTHMSPIFTIAVWPLTFIFRKKIVFWYLHRSITFKLKIAEKLCFKLVTASGESLKLKSDKIMETGHGINLEKYKVGKKFDQAKLRILSVGRISKIKNFDILLKAVKILKEQGIGLEVKIVGRPVMPSDTEYLSYLKSLIDEFEINDLVQFTGFIPHNRISDYYLDADIVLGLTPDGGIDKTILEGMASGCLVLVSNNACKKYFGKYSDSLLFKYRDPEDLAKKIIELSNLSSNAKEEIISFLIKSVSENHELGKLINLISSLY